MKAVKNIYIWNGVEKIPSAIKSASNTASIFNTNDDQWYDLHNGVLTATGVFGFNTGGLSTGDILVGDFTVDSISDIKDIPGLAEGDKVFVGDRDIGFTVIADSVRQYWKSVFIVGGRNDRVLAESILPISFEIGDTIELVFRVPSTSDTSELHLGKFYLRDGSNNQLQSVGWRDRGSLVLGSTHGECFQSWRAESLNGIVLDSTNLPYDTWIKGIWTCTKAFTNDLRMYFGHASVSGVSAEYGMLSAKYKDETIYFDSYDGEYFYTDKGTKYYYEDFAGIESEPILIDNTDLGNGYDIIEILDGDNYFLLEMNVTDGFITPRNFGAISNSSINVFENDATEILQACFDSKYSIDMGALKYYVTGPMTVKRPKTILMHGKKPVYYAAEAFYGTVLYTDKNVDILRIAADSVFITGGGVIDVSNVANPTGFPKAITYMYQDTLIVSGKCDMAVFGDSETIKPEGAGFIGMFFDTTTNFDWGLAQGNGECHNVEIDLRASYCYIGLLASSKPEWNTLSRSTNTMRLHMEAASCKKALVLDGYFAVTSITGFAQCGYCLAESEKDFIQVELSINQINYDFYVWDVAKVDLPPVYYPQMAVLVNGYAVNLSARAYWNFKNKHIIANYPLSNFLPGDEPTEMQFMRSTTTAGHGGFIEPLDNVLFNYHKRESSYSINTYSNDGSFDLEYVGEANGQPGATLNNSLITLSYSDVLLFKWHPTGNEVTFDPAFDDDDFIEIIVPNLSTHFNPFDVATFGISFYGDNFPLKVVLIAERSSQGNIARTIDTSGWDGQSRGRQVLWHIIGNGDCEKLIIRLVGVQNNGIKMYVSQVVAQLKDRYNKNLPYINIEGDQEIFGTLKSRVVNNNGASGDRPITPVNGEQFFDSTLGKPIWWTGSNWVDATGATV